MLHTYFKYNLMVYTINMVLVYNITIIVFWTIFPTNLHKRIFIKLNWNSVINSRFFNLLKRFYSNSIVQKIVISKYVCLRIHTLVFCSNLSNFATLFCTFRTQSGRFIITRIVAVAPTIPLEQKRTNAVNESLRLAKIKKTITIFDPVVAQTTRGSKRISI